MTGSFIVLVGAMGLMHQDAYITNYNLTRPTECVGCYEVNPIAAPFVYDELWPVASLGGNALSLFAYEHIFKDEISRTLFAASLSMAELGFISTWSMNKAKVIRVSAPIFVYEF
jgi:hypothetical protein